MSIPTDEIALGVGWVAIEASKLESIASLLLEQLVQSDVARTIAQGQAWSVVVQSTTAVVARRRGLADLQHEEWRFPFYDRMTAAMANAESLMSRRADAIHGFWFPDLSEQGGPNLSTHRSRRYGKSSTREWLPGDLAALRAELRAAVREISDLLNWFVNNRPSPLV